MVPKTCPKMNFTMEITSLWIYRLFSDILFERPVSKTGNDRGSDYVSSLKYPFKFLFGLIILFGFAEGVKRLLRSSAGRPRR